VQQAEPVSEAVVAIYGGYGTSPEGFDAEWRNDQLLTVKGDKINSCEHSTEGRPWTRAREIRRPQGRPDDSPNGFYGSQPLYATAGEEPESCCATGVPACQNSTTSGAIRSAPIRGNRGRAPKSAKAP